MDEISHKFLREIRQHRRAEYVRSKFSSRNYDEQGNPAGSEMYAKVHYDVAIDPGTSIVEEADELPVNFYRRPGGRGRKASSFISPKTPAKKGALLNHSCIPGLHNPIPLEQSMRPNNTGEQPTGIPGLASSFRNNIQPDQSFVSEPSDSDDTIGDTFNESYKFADQFPVAPVDYNMGLRDYNPDAEKEFYEARDWISDNMSRGALPSEMEGEEEVARNIANNSFNDSILSIHNVSRDDYKVNPIPKEWLLADSQARVTGRTSLPLSNKVDKRDEINPATGQPMWFNPRGGENSLNTTGNSSLNSSLNSTADSQRRSSWEKNKGEIIQRLYMGDGVDPTLANRTFPVPSKNLKGLYTPLAKKTQSPAPNPDTSQAPDLDFGNITTIPSPYPYEDIKPDPRTSTPLKALANKKDVDRLSNTANISSIGDQNSFFSKFDSADYSRLNKVIRGNLSKKADSTASQPPNEDSKVAENCLDSKLNDTTVNPLDEKIEPDDNIPAVCPTNSDYDSSNIHYELNSSELLGKLSESLSADKKPADEKLNKSVGDKQGKLSEKAAKRKLDLNPYGSPQAPTSGQNRTVTLTDSGYGVSVHNNECDCSIEEKIKNNCVSLKDSGATLKIVTESDVSRPPCCKNTKGKLNYVAAVNAKKISKLSKIVKRKTLEFQVMLAENLKLAQKNFQLKSVMQDSNMKFLRQRNLANEIEAKHQALQQKFELVEYKTEQLEQETNGKKREHQQSEQVINTMTRNYDKMADLLAKQSQEVDNLNEQIEEVEEANKEMAETLRDIGVIMQINELERSQNDSTFSSMAEDNSMLRGQCNSYQVQVAGLEDSIEILDSRLQDLSTLNESLAMKNRELAVEASLLNGSGVAAEQSANASVNISANKKHDHTIDDSVKKIVEFYSKVSNDLQSQVEQKDKRISELESSMNNTTLGSSLNDTTVFQSFNQSLNPSLEKSSLERTTNCDEVQQKLSSAQNEARRLKSVLRDAKTITNLGSSLNDTTLFQSFNESLNPSLENSSLERTTNCDEVQQKLSSAQNEARRLKSVLRAAKTITTLGSSLNDTTMFQSFNESLNPSLENSSLERTTNCDEIQQKLSSAQNEARRLKSVLHNAKTKTSLRSSLNDTSLFQSFNESLNPSLDNSSLERTTNCDEVQQKLFSAQNEAQRLKSVLRDAKNITTLGSSLNDTSLFQSFNQSLNPSLDNSSLERTTNCDEVQQKLSSARNEARRLRSVLRDAKTIIKEVAINPTISSDPTIVSALENMFKEVQRGEVSLDNSQLERTIDFAGMGPQITSAKNEVAELKTLLHHAKVIMKELADDPTKSSNPLVLTAFDTVYKQVKKVDKKNVSFDASMIVA